MQQVEDVRIAVVGLGYVGLPLAVEFAKQLPVVGFDIKESRVAELQGGHDRTLEVSDAELAETARLTFTADPADIAGCTVFIVTTPTPVNEHKQPDLSPVLSATDTIARVLKAGDVVHWQMLTQAAAEPRGRVLTLTQDGRRLTLEADVDVVWTVTEATELCHKWDSPLENFRIVSFERKAEADGEMKHAVSIRRSL